MNFQNAIDERYNMIEPICEEFRNFKQDLMIWASGNERAGQRARVASVKLGKQLKKFREISLGK